MLDFIEKIFTILGCIVLGFLVIAGIVLGFQFFAGDGGGDDGDIGKIIIIIIVVAIVVVLLILLLKGFGKLDYNHPVLGALLSAIFYAGALLLAVAEIIPAWVSLIVTFIVSIITSMKAYDKAEMVGYDVNYYEHDEYTDRWHKVKSTREYIDYGIPGLIIKTIFYVGIPALSFYAIPDMGNVLLIIPAAALVIKFIFRLITSR